MARIKMLLSSTKATVALFALAVLLLLGDGIGVTKAAVIYFSETYSARLEMFDIGVSLVENDEVVSYRNYDKDAQGNVRLNQNTGVLLANMLEDGQNFRLEHTYPEVLKVKNSGNIDQYVRVKLYKYWMNPDGTKNRELTPDLIHLHLVNIGNTNSSSPWILDEESSTAERTILYYRDVLPATDTNNNQLAEDDALRYSVPFTDALTVSGTVADRVSQTVKETSTGKIITTSYKYDSLEFRIEAEVDTVQTHSGAEAIHSAWGIDPAMLSIPETGHHTGKFGWQVTFTQNETMESNFKTADLDEVVSGMQPGDDITFTITLKNSHSDTTDWYMTNKVIRSMEDNSAAQGGAYTYKLIYTNPMNEVTTLYESERVGGENTTGGLREATNALEDFFFLDTLKSGQRGRVILQIGLDGETLGNSYQDTLADLQMNFAVGELRPDHTVAANIVKDQMGALLEKSNVKRSDKDVVESVRAPYENLTGDQKMKVKDSTLKKLIDVEEILENQNINGVNSHNGETDSKKLEKESVSSDYYNSMDSLPCISGVEEGTGGVITVQLEDSKPGYILIAAIYDINGQFLDLQEVTLTDNEESHTFDFTGTEYDHAKAMLLDEDWRPVCENAVVNTSKAEKGDLEIIMNLTGYEDSEPASFVFKVTACDKNNNVVYSNVSLLNFTEPGQKFILLKNLPVGSKVTVKEYCIGHYTADTASEVTPDGVISESKVLLAEFTGSYNSYCKGGHGILNEFVYGKQNGSSKENTWNWLNPAEKAAQ